MIRRFALLLAAPALLSAASPLAEAEREAREAQQEQAQLEAAAADARSEAERAAAQRGAAAAALIAAEAASAAGEARLAELGRRKAALERRLAEERRPATALLAGLADAGRRPPWLALLGSGGVERQVHLSVLAREIRPEIDRRTNALRQQYDALGKLGEQERSLQADLGRQRAAAVAARERFASLEREALSRAEARGAEAVVAGDRVLAQGERTALLASDYQRRREATRLAAQLAELPAAAPRPVSAEGRAAAPPLAWSRPATGALVTGAGELLPNGVRARGMTIAAGRGTQVSAPAAGRVVFAGPFRRREGIVILDHGGGWMTLLSEVRPSVKVGDPVERGSPIGRALGPVTAELFRDGKAEPAALIARSS